MTFIYLLIAAVPPGRPLAGRSFFIFMDVYQAIEMKPTGFYVYVSLFSTFYLFFFISTILLYSILDYSNVTTHFTSAGGLNIPYKVSLSDIFPDNNFVASVDVPDDYPSNTVHRLKIPIDTILRDFWESSVLLKRFCSVADHSGPNPSKMKVFIRVWELLRYLFPFASIFTVALACIVWITVFKNDAELGPENILPSEIDASHEIDSASRYLPSLLIILSIIY